MEFWQVSPVFHSIFRHEKKVLALVLAFACAFTMFAGAASFTDESDIQAMDAVNMLTALGVIEGYEDGSFQPDGTVTRAEMAKMIFVVRNNTIDDAAYEDVTSNLTDITNHWAKGYIKFCESQGIIAGKGNGIFDPDAPVTGTEAAKMLLVLAGYEPSKAGLEGTNWATNTLRYAGAAGILDDVSSGLEAGLPRQYAAQMIANTLEATRVKWSADSESFDDVLNGGIKETVGYAYMDLCTDIGVLVSISGDSADIILSRSDDADNFHKIKDGYQVSFSKIATDYSDLFGQKVKVMFKDGKTNNVLGVYAVADNTVATANQKDIEVDAGKLKIDGVKYTLESNGVAVYINGDPEDVNYKAGDFEKSRSANVLTFIDSDGNNKIDTACIKTIDVAKVTYASSTQIIAGGKTYKYDEDTISEGLAKDDWVVITENLYNENKDVVKADVTSGKVEATKDKGGWTQYQIDGEWYNEADTTISTASTKDINSNVRGGVDADFVAVNGILYYAHKTAGADSSLTNVLFVSYVGTNGLNDDQAKVMFPNGDKATITLAEKSFDADWDGDFTDGGSAQVINNTNAAGHFFEYTKSGNNYKLIALRPEAQFSGYYGDYTNMATLTMTDANGGATTSDKVEKVDTLTIDDDADVILFAAKGDWTATDVKHITGKQLKNLKFSAGGATDNDNGVEATAIGAFSSKVNGLTRATVLAVRVDNTDGSLSGISIGGSYAHYGYVLDDAKQIDDYTIEFPMWNGETGEQITVQVAETNEANFKAGRAFGYAKMTTDENGVNTLVDVDPLGSPTVASILEVDSKNPNKIVVDNGVGEIDLDNYTTVLYVNSAEKTGLTGVTATEANSIKVGTTDYYAKNIMIKGDLVVIDVIELATGVYENVTLPTSVSGLTSVQYVNNHTQKTDENAHVNSYLTVTVQAPTAGTLTLTNGLFVDTDTNTRSLVAGENKFEVVITNTGFAMSFGAGAAQTPAEGVAPINVSTAADLAAAFNSVSTLKVNDDYTIPTGASIPAGKTLYVNGDATVAGSAAFGSGATLEVASGKKIIAGASAAIPNNATLKGEVDTSSNKLTVSGGNVTITGNVTGSNGLEVTNTANVSVTGVVANVVNVASGAKLNITGTATTVTANAGTITVTNGSIGAVTANTGTINVPSVPTTITSSTGTLVITGNVAATADVTGATNVTFKGTVGAELTVDSANVLVFEKSIDLKTVFGATIDGTNAGLKVTFKEVPTNLYVAAGTALTAEATEGAFVANATTTPAITPVVDKVYTLTDNTYNTDKAAFVGAA